METRRMLRMEWGRLLIDFSAGGVTLEGPWMKGRIVGVSWARNPDLRGAWVEPWNGRW